MSTSNVKPVYPNGILPWTDRVDGQSIDFAEDINTAVSDLESVETTLGTNPQIEPSPPTGSSIVYGNVSERITDAMGGLRLPYISVGQHTVTVPNTTQGLLVPFYVNTDPYSYFNGTDISIINSGWWVVTGSVEWPWWDQGYVRMEISNTNGILSEDVIDWTFSGNTLPASGTIITPRWQLFGKRPRWAAKTWMGQLAEGDRISMYLENGTSSATQVVNNLTLKAVMVRAEPGYEA